jgi:hypothetical protein
MLPPLLPAFDDGNILTDENVIGFTIYLLFKRLRRELAFSGGS